MAHCSSIAQPHDSGLSRMLVAWLGLGFAAMLGPGALTGLASGLGANLAPFPPLGSADWIRHHAHAQIFGWMGSFVFGISLYAVPRLRNEALCLSRAWAAFALWASGLLIYFTSPIAAGAAGESLGLTLQSAGAVTVASAILPPRPVRYRGLHPCLPVIAVGVWTLVLATGLETVRSLAVSSISFSDYVPARTTVLLIALWGGLATTTFGYATRWLPAIMNLRPTRSVLFRFIAAAQMVAVALLAAGLYPAGMFIVLVSTLSYLWAVRIFEPLAGAPRTRGVHGSFTFFVRLAHLWLAIAAVTSFLDFAQAGSYWPSTSRHLLTVGFLASMIAAIGPRMLPAFIIRVRLFSKRLMFASMAAIGLGVTIRVANIVAASAELVPSPQSWFQWFALLEVGGLLLFAANAILTAAVVPTVQQALGIAPAAGVRSVLAESKK